MTGHSNYGGGRSNRAAEIMIALSVGLLAGVAGTLSGDCVTYIP